MGVQEQVKTFLFMTVEKNSQMLVPAITELSDRLYQVIADAFDRTFRGYLQGKDVKGNDKYFLFQSGLPHPIANLLITRNQDDAALLIEGVEPLCSDKFPSAVVFLGQVGSEADELLRSRSFELAEKMPAMAIDLHDLTITTLGDDYTIQQVGADEHDLWVDTFAKGYELPYALADRFGPAMVASIAEEAEEYRYYIVFHNSRAVSTALDIIRDGIIEVYCISTITEYRGRGIGRFVTGEPLRLASDEGYRTAILQASLQGESVYRYLGFESFGDIPLYVRIPAA